MKKILSILMILTFSTLLFGCDETESKFWEKAYNNWNTCTETTEYIPYFNANVQIEYLQNQEDIRSTLSSNVEYNKLLTNYEFLLDATMEVVAVVANTLEVKPLNTSSKTKDIYNEFEEKLGNFTNKVSSFENKKQDFASRIDLDNINSAYSMQLLKETKREMRKLISSANELKNAVIVIYEETIKDYPTVAVDVISASTMKFLKLEQLSCLISAQINYLYEFEIDKENYYDSNILNEVEEVLNQMKTISNATYKEFELEKEYTKRLKTETELFLIALQNIEMQTYFEDGEYIIQNPNITGHISKVLYYIND